MNSRCALFTILIAGVTSIFALAGCNPLPAGNLDPVFMQAGFGSRKAPSEAPAPQPTAPGVQASPRLEARTRGATAWAGRYQDSRGAGAITMSLVRGETTASGTWQIRTGGGGPITLTGASGQRLALRMENTVPECPGTFEGWAEITETALMGAYHGKDCEGAVMDGRIELRPK